MVGFNCVHVRTDRYTRDVWLSMTQTDSVEAVNGNKRLVVYYLCNSASQSSYTASTNAVYKCNVLGVRSWRVWKCPAEFLLCTNTTMREPCAEPTQCDDRTCRMASAANTRVPIRTVAPGTSSSTVIVSASTTVTSFVRRTLALEQQSLPAQR